MTSCLLTGQVSCSPESSQVWESSNPRTYECVYRPNVSSTSWMAVVAWQMFNSLLDTIKSCYTDTMKVLIGERYHAHVECFNHRFEIEC